MQSLIRSFLPDELEFQMFVLDEMADAQQQRGADVIKLTIGVSDLTPSPHVWDRISQKLTDVEFSRRVFPEGIPELREAVSDYYRERYGVTHPPSNVLVSTGTSPIFRNLFQLLGGPGKAVVLPKPYYALYLYCAHLSNSTVRFYDIDPDTGRIDASSLSRACAPPDTALVVLNYPGNPLGNLVTPTEINAIYDGTDNNVFVLSDEIYANVVFDGEFTSPLTARRTDASRTIVTNGFSKGFALYTKRIGYALLPPELQRNLRVAQQHTLLCADPCTQYGVIAALEDRSVPEATRKTFSSRAAYTVQKLSGTGCRPVPSHGGFYTVLRCSAWNEAKGFADSKELARDILGRVSVAVVPGTDFGLDQDLRLSFCNRRYEEGIDRLQTYFTE